MCTDVLSGFFPHRERCGPESSFKARVETQRRQRQKWSFGIEIRTKLVEQRFLQTAGWGWHGYFFSGGSILTQEKAWLRFRRLVFACVRTYICISFSILILNTFRVKTWTTQTSQFAISLQKAPILHGMETSKVFLTVTDQLLRDD